MPILHLTLDPNSLLRKKLTEISVVDISGPEIQTLIEDMRVTMIAAQGIGLAGNQVGRDLQIFTIDKTLAKEAGISDVFINPTINDAGEKTSVMEEGCLSIPGNFDEVRRPSTVIVSALDDAGKKFTVQAKGLLARVLQHETDHLNGFLFIDRIS